MVEAEQNLLREATKQTGIAEVSRGMDPLSTVLDCLGGKFLLSIDEIILE